MELVGILGNQPGAGLVKNLADAWHMGSPFDGFLTVTTDNSLLSPGFPSIRQLRCLVIPACTTSIFHLNKIVERFYGSRRCRSKKDHNDCCYLTSSTLKWLPVSRTAIISVGKGFCQGVRDNRFDKESFTLSIEYYMNFIYTVIFDLEKTRWVAFSWYWMICKQKGGQK